MAMLLLNLALIVVSIAIFIWGVIHIDQQQTLAGILMGVAIFYWCLPVWLLFAGLRVVHPNEALVMTLFGKYVGTLKGAGFYFVNPFMTAAPVPKASHSELAAGGELETEEEKQPGIS